MISKAQSKRYAPRPTLETKPKLSALEKGLLRWTVAERGDKVLDAYVVNGLMLEYLQRNMECEVCGVSDDMERVRASRSRLSNADICYALREDIPWKPDTFDSVYVNMAAAPFAESTLREILRVLKPGGQLLVGFTTVPNPLRALLGLARPELDEELTRPRVRARALTLMHALGLNQITWQRTDLFNSVAIAWKPIEPHAV
jgi:SAM-dependent methyltransferase